MPIPLLAPVMRYVSPDMIEKLKVLERKVLEVIGADCEEEVNES